MSKTQTAAASGNQQVGQKSLLEMSFVELQRLSNEQLQEADLAVLVVERKSSFEISIAKTKQAIARKTQEYQTCLVKGHPDAIVAIADDIESLEKGLGLLNKHYQILFPAN